jgi:hypothetical protein
MGEFMKWSFLENFKNNYLISKFNYLIFLKKKINFFLTNFPNNYLHSYNYLILFPYSPT